MVHGAALTTHYPSWGSGSLVSPLRVELECHLTTPHGDRDPVFVGVVLPLLLELTTPHGDRDPERSISSRRCSAISLPLMGIGIQHDVAHADEWPRGSLPLMGIGIFGIAAGVYAMSLRSLPLMGIGISRYLRSLSTPMPSSLPLMGIGIAPRLAVIELRPATLTTPHGDRDRATATGRTELGDNSLPLMGIGIPFFRGSDGS